MSFEGYGNAVTGGAGGSVLMVTTLDDSGAGSLRTHLAASGPRIIRFAVEGVIQLLSPLVIDNANVTVEGQSAPGAGITIYNPRTSLTGSNAESFQSIWVRANNVILQHLAIRPGVWPYVPGEDVVTKGPTDISGIFVGCTIPHVHTGHQDHVVGLVVDHCSISEVTARCLSMHNASDLITVSWCVLARGIRPTPPERPLDGGGGKGASIHDGVDRVSFHHNVWADLHGRMPQTSLRCDIRNNIIYDWWDHGADMLAANGNTQVNFVSNWVEPPGPHSVGHYGLTAHDWRGAVAFPLAGTLGIHLDDHTQLARGTQWGLQGKVAKWIEATQSFQFITLAGSEYEMLTPLAAPAITPSTRYEVLAGAGRFPRDALDAEVMAELGYFVPIGAPTVTLSTPANERRRLSQDAIIVLNLLDYSRLVEPTEPGWPDAYTFRFSDAVARDLAEPMVAGVGYRPMPVMFSGSRIVSQGAPPRPSIRLYEVVPGMFADLVAATDDLRGARLRRMRIHRRHLDDGDAPNPNAIWWPPEEWIVVRKLVSTALYTEFLLGTVADLEDVTLPAGRIEHNYCPWVYGPRRSASDPALCTWTQGAGPYFKADDTETTEIAEDACGFRYMSCKKRFGARKLPLDFGGYPSIERIAQPASRS